jgi:carbon monoxide dehydrogenase subunit G
MAKVEGSETLSLPRAEVWRRLNDPDILADSIPGCGGFELIEQDMFQTSITVAVGPVRGAYAGTVRYLDVEAPERCTIAVEGRGDKGTIQGEGAIRLGESDAGTEVSYTGTFKLTGPVAGVGQRLAPGISRRMIVETLQNLERAPRGAATRSGDCARAPTERVIHPPSAGGLSFAETDPAVPAPPVVGAPRPAVGAPSSVDFRPLALSTWGAFALGFATGVLTTLILEAAL